MLSVFNVMAAERYRLRSGFWPLFFVIVTAIIAFIGAWSQVSTYQSGSGAGGSADVILPWIAASDLALGVMICQALLRPSVTLANSNYIRSQHDRRVYAAVHALLSLAITLVTVCLGAVVALAVRASLGMPFAALDPAALFVWLCQATLISWSVCLAGLCVGYARRSTGTATVAVVLVTLGVPGTLLAFPFMACGLDATAFWFAENQPNAWLGALVRGELLDGAAVAVLAVSCIALLLLLSVISVRRDLK